MTISGILPRRWRSTPEQARHAEAIEAVLQTAPLEQAQGGPTIISLLGAADVLEYLVAIKSLHRHLGRGRMAVVDDGTLTGEDRAILAHHCGDPEIIHHQAVRRGPFPPEPAWALLLTILDRRGGDYWIALDPHTVTLGPVYEVAGAIASNRSFVGRDCGGIAGFAAGGPGRTNLAPMLADRSGEKAMAADEAMNRVLAEEIHPFILPREVYAAWRGEAVSDDPALVHFPPRHRFAGDEYMRASAAAIDDLAY